MDFSSVSRYLPMFMKNATEQHFSDTYSTFSDNSDEVQGVHSHLVASEGNVAADDNEEEPLRRAIALSLEEEEHLKIKEDQESDAC